MTVTIGSFSCSALTAQPFGYDETDTSAGLTARKWILNGLLTPSQWDTLLTVYNNWRDTRIDDPDTLQSLTVGTTVNLTASANGLDWTTVACWFIQAPQGTQAGYYISVEAEVVDAAQALEVLKKEQEKQKEREDGLRPDLGTLTIGTTTLDLLKPKETYANPPQVQLTAAGNHYLSGPLTASRIYDAEGETNATGWTGIQTWYEAIVQTIPSSGTFFPFSVPTATARAEIQAGVKTTIYTVSVQLVEI